MNTISSANSLLIWKHNINGSGIWPSMFGKDDLFLKENYENVFRTIATLLNEKNRASFVDIWQKTCATECKTVLKKICDLSEEIPEETAKMVVDKFRGNLGEIFVEMLAVNGLLDFIDAGSYKTVDPEHEQFIDAEATRNGLPIGIQIKNYKNGNLVGHEVMMKAAAMSDLWLRHDKKVKIEDVPEFLKTPCQYVVSMTDIQTDMFSDWYHDCVIFIGPNKIEQKKIQGSVKTGENAKWRMFEVVANEIASFQNA